LFHWILPMPNSFVTTLRIHGRDVNVWALSGPSSAPVLMSADRGQSGNLVLAPILPVLTDVVEKGLDGRCEH
jgi:hypothetical protein